MSLLTKVKTYLRILASYKRGRTVLGYFPPLIWVEPTNGCNLRCAMCPNSVIEKRGVGTMDREAFVRIADEAGRYYQDGECTLALFLGGEPLLHGGIFEFISLARSRKLAVNLATNATLLTQEKIDSLLSAPPSLLIVSFDGYDKDSYERARVGAEFESTLEKVRHLVREKKRRNLREPLIRLYSLILRTDRSEEEREKYLSFYRREFHRVGADEILIREADDWAGLFEGTAGETFRPDERKGSAFHPCPRLWYSMSVLWDGRVVPCCADFDGKLVLGDVREKSLMEIWNDRPLVALRERMVAGDLRGIPMCGDGCKVPYPNGGEIFGIPGEMLIHRMILRDRESRRLAGEITGG
jgi:MoaA/NifB/PqqE/SkfB family radical SAM enzyme